jgi:hypothetical protein
VLIAAQDVSRSSPRLKHPYLIAWRSNDRGATWSEPRLLGDDPKADVWLQAGPRGRFFAAYLRGTEPLEENYTMAAVFQRSEDGGETWKEARVLGSKADKTVLAVSPSGQRLAVAYNPLAKPQAAVLRSEDGGENWLAVPRAAPRGWAYVPWGLVVNDDCAIAAGWTLRTNDPKAKAKLLVSATQDAGKTWKDQDLATYSSSQAAPVGFLGAAAVVLALGGSGTAHAVYSYPAGEKNTFGLLYRRSADLQTWSDPVSLSSGDAADFRGYPAVAAAGGRVHVAWMERAGGLYNVWYRGSADGGKHWSKPRYLSRPAQPTKLLTAEGFKEPSGDYMSLAEDGRGTAHAAWGVAARQGVGGEREIWHCAIRLRPEEGRVK